MNGADTLIDSFSVFHTDDAGDDSVRETVRQDMTHDHYRISDL